MSNPADLLTKAVDQATLERLLWSTGVSRLEAPEVAEITTTVKKNMVHVNSLSAFIVASVLAGAAGYEDDEQDGR